MVELRKEKQGSGPIITAFTPTGFRLDDRRFDGGLLLTPLRADGWTSPKIEQLDALHVELLLSLDPPLEFILLGTGPGLVHPPRSFVRALEARGLGVDAMDSRAAARAWGVLRSEDRWIGAALMPLKVP